MINAKGNDNKRISYSGEISIDPAVKIVGFKGAGLSVNVGHSFCIYASDTLNFQYCCYVGLYHTYAVPTRSCKVAVPRSTTSYSGTFGD